jgi:Domain of unknown function (DUF1843)
MSSRPDSYFGPIPPYGVAIREAAASGDASRLTEATAQGRRWLSENAGHPSFGEVQAALREVESQQGRGS